LSRTESSDQGFLGFHPDPFTAGRCPGFGCGALPCHSSHGSMYPGGGAPYSPIGGGGVRAGPEGGIPPPPQLKNGRGTPYPPAQKRQGYPLPPHPCLEAIPPPKGTLGVPPPFFRALVYVGEPVGCISPDWGLPPTPHCLRPAVGTPCHLFCAWDPPSPQVKKGRGPPTPPPVSRSHTPTQGYLGGTYPPFPEGASRRRSACILFRRGLWEGGAPAMPGERDLPPTCSQWEGVHMGWGYWGGSPNLASGLMRGKERMREDCFSISGLCVWSVRFHWAIPWIVACFSRRVITKYILPVYNQ
jgi:hypothetical protein